MYKRQNNASAINQIGDSPVIRSSLVNSDWLIIEGIPEKA